MADGIKWFTGALEELLNSPGGATGRWLAREGVKIQNRAKLNATGPPHGYYRGRRYASAPGHGPGVRTGRGRASITSRVGYDGAQLVLDVGTNVYYMGILELRANAPYPWLIPAFEAEGYTVKKL